MTTTTHTLPETEIVGPYSPRPRRHVLRCKKVGLAAAVASAGVILHCGVPMLF